MSKFNVWLCVALTTELFFSCRSNVTEKVQPSSGGGFTQQPSTNRTISGSENLATAAKAVTPGVVHIKTMYEHRQASRSVFEDPSRRGATPSMGSGSGVVISADGYIATNNHVVENASQVEVVFPDRHSFTAKVVGRDPNTDLALLKVEARNLPFVILGNSDDALVGEWVLAVGYPYSLNTTVTAGIISAKGRSIGIINTPSERNPQGSSAVESFIQTDAAINPGNSGGALVNINGELIGINTAIASLTGSYAGYAFAIPVNLAKKILDDLKEFGTVKRGLLGVSFPSPQGEDQYLKQQGITPGSVKGVFITSIQKGSAADEAGLEEGDVIQRIDSTELFSSAEFSERIARHRPGDKIYIDYLRNGKLSSTTATLKNEKTQTPVAGNEQSLRKIYDKLGATFAPLTEAFKQRFNLDAGVVVTEILAGGFFDQLGILPGTVIVYINGRSVNSPQDIDELLVAAQNSRMQILGIAPDGSRIAFNFSLGA
ncbi:MAG: trypsin-like peptidase domain-containing protein [Ferruginibacter sp.]